MEQTKFSILLVDDEKNERKGIEKLIQKNGYNLQVFQAENGVDALKIFKEKKIDILLTDIKMPFMDGMELIKEVHKEGWDPVCIIYSAYGEFEYAQNAIALGVIQYLLKPIKLSEFRNLFEKVLSICQTKKEQEEQNQVLKLRLETAENIQLSKEILSVLDSKAEKNSKILDQDILKRVF